MKVSVIICTYTADRLKDLHEAVQSVMNQTYKPDEIIIAVDHNPELFKKLKSELPPSIKVVLNTNTLGLSETRNVGIRASQGDIIAFIDDDAVAQKDWLENLLKHYSNPSVVAVGGRSIPVWNNGRRPDWFPEELYWIIGCTYKGLPLLNKNEIRNVPGCNMAFRKEIFKEVGFFKSEMGGIKETPRGGEEADLCLRIRCKLPDALILYESNAVIYHRGPSWRLNLKYIVRRSFNEGFYKAKVQKIHGRNSRGALSTESTYLRYLLFKSVPQRVRHFYKVSYLFQTGAIMVSILATGLGYLTGKIEKG